MSNKRAEPTEEQLNEAYRNGVLLWKGIQDIEHIKNAVPDGCKCSLCEAARSAAQAARGKNDKKPEFKIPSFCPKMRRAFSICIDKFDVNRQPSPHWPFLRRLSPRLRCMVYELELYRRKTERPECSLDTAGDAIIQILKGRGVGPES
jgi:hypothetical protein